MPYFSKSTLGFYIDKSSAPQDAIEIPESSRLSILKAQSVTSGSRVAADESGMPVLMCGDMVVANE